MTFGCMLPTVTPDTIWRFPLSSCRLPCELPWWLGRLLRQLSLCLAGRDRPAESSTSCECPQLRRSPVWASSGGHCAVLRGVVGGRWLGGPTMARHVPQVEDDTSARKLGCSMPSTCAGYLAPSVSFPNFLPRKDAEPARYRRGLRDKECPLNKGRRCFGICCQWPDRQHGKCSIFHT